ncbi:MAG: protoheme IX farnesyltransferase [Deltaproteobacteria bacterium]|nr:protoheme IX farnesyltransferase [Deltaproteobacteria bacterium]
MKPKLEIVRSYLQLTKPRICLLALGMATVGFVFASDQPADWQKLWFALAGTAFIGAAAGALNQYLERDIDCQMRRTLVRPIPSGIISPQRAFSFGIYCAVFGVATLLYAVNFLTAALGAATLVFYLGVYTPLKRTSPISTFMGGVAGAVPPLMGVTAATGLLRWEGLLLFSVLYFWQIPHAMAVAWMFRDDFTHAGLPLLPVLDEEGWVTSIAAVLCSMILLPIVLLPWFWEKTGALYFWGGTLLGIIYFGFALSLMFNRSLVAAKRLFVYSLVYLPSLGFLLMWDKRV